jgi:hypothetical protein
MFLTIVAVVLAKTFTILAGYWLLKHIPEAPPAKLFMLPEPKPLPKDFSEASDKNVFHARREVISLNEEQEEEEEPGRWQDAQLSSLPLKLVSTMVFSDPFDSRAIIYNLTSNISSIYSIGQCEEYHKNYDEMKIETVLPSKDWQPQRSCNNIDSMATVLRIEEDRVYIFNLRSHKYEYLSLLGESGRRHRPILESFAPVEGEGIRRVGPTSFEIDQSEFDKALANIARLMTEARAVPEIDASGKYVGFKILYLKEGSLLEKIGLEKMDILTRINGYELNSPEAALQLFSKLKTASQFTIDLKRNDRSVTLDYSVVR